MVIEWVVMAALVSALLWVHAARRWPLEWLVKPAASATFVFAGATSGLLDTGWGRVLFAGLLLAALGDVLLIPKDRRTFLLGLVSFLLGHVAYAAAFVVRGVDVVWTASAGLLLALLALPILRWLWPHVEGPMKPPVAGYVVVITAMVALAAGTVAERGGAPILVGAIGFYLSDLSVARDRFVGGSLANRAWGLPLYFASQLLLATSP